MVRWPTGEADDKQQFEKPYREAMQSESALRTCAQYEYTDFAFTFFYNIEEEEEIKQQTLASTGKLVSLKKKQIFVIDFLDERLLDESSGFDLPKVRETNCSQEKVSKALEVPHHLQFQRPPLVAEHARMIPPFCLAGTLTMALFLSCLRPESLDPCVEVDPNITYQCMDQNLNRVPDNIPSSVKNLDLSFNPLKILGSHSFSNFPELQLLDLS
ncbi:hypothetical protein STEG23_028703, partial [Scotinomys teguina]